MPITHQA